VENFYFWGMALDIDNICNDIIDGLTYRQMSVKYTVPLSTLFDFIHKDEHSARAKAAISTSASMYADKAEEVLIAAESDKNEIQRARELAQHYRWKASKRNPKAYGDKIDLTSAGEKLAAPIIIDWNGANKDNPNT
jgi:hypothetical protein